MTALQKRVEAMEKVGAGSLADEALRKLIHLQLQKYGEQLEAALRELEPLERQYGISSEECQCEFCDGTLDKQIVRARFAFKGQTVYVDHVPAWVCTHCGEQYYDAPVFKRLEVIAKQAHRIKKKVTFPLADYDPARA